MLLDLPTDLLLYLLSLLPLASLVAVAGTCRELQEAAGPYLCTSIQARLRTRGPVSPDMCHWYLTLPATMIQRDAMKTFRLSANLLRPVPHTERHVGGYSTCYIYRRDDLVKACLKKWKSFSLLQEADSKYARAAAKAGETRKRKRDQAEIDQEARRVSLVARLHAMGLGLRADSALCRIFIETGSPIIGCVVQTMAKMKYNYEYVSGYGDMRRKAARHVRESYGFLPRDEYYRLIDSVTNEMLEAKGVTYPDVWPWLVGTK